MARDSEGHLMDTLKTLHETIPAAELPKIDPIMRVCLEIAVPNHGTQTVDIISTEGFIKLGPDATPSKVRQLMTAQINDVIIKMSAHKPSPVVKKETLGEGIQ